MDPLRFLFVVHNHQPLGNFDEVIQALTDQAYRPFLKAIQDRPALKLTLHLSGPLLLWMERRAGDVLDLVGELVGRGQVEMLLGGLYEPILAAIPREDRVAQITMMAERIRDRFGVRSRGLWLTERVWDGAIVPSLAEAGISYVLMDDRAFLASGFPADRLHDYYLTEADGATVAVFPIDKRLRYLIPFRPPTEIARYLRQVAAQGGRLAIAADDGEKFGAWPGTAKWVYEDGWLKGFLDLIEGASEWLSSVTVGEALDQLGPAGLCYLPTCSYAEMEEWTLGPEGGRRFAELRARLDPDLDRFAPYVRGGHWKHFLVRYPEANRAHKKGLALSRRLPRGRRATRARHELLAAQCNDAYWHGIFGGLYLPHLRHEIWRRLARAEAALRRGQRLQVEAVDLDCDGFPEVWVHSSAFSGQVQPHRGGRLVEWTDLVAEINYLNTLTRRPEAYHDDLRKRWEGSAREQHGGIPGIHTLHRAAPHDLANALFYDRWDRAAFLDHFFVESEPLAAWVSGRLDDLGDFADAAWQWRPTPSGAVLERSGSVRTAPDRLHPLLLRKRFTFTDAPGVVVDYEVINQGRDALVLRLGVELNFFLPGLAFGRSRLGLGSRVLSLDSPTSATDVESVTLAALEAPRGLRVRLRDPATVYGHLLATVSQSERGYEQTVQGVAVMPSWDLRLAPAEAWTQTFGIEAVSWPPTGEG
jgi:hypothetical protein